ncbi:hypothetical protein SXCC_01295 [Gluconacetobacter sp. SXCC-1]|nr:hypothetical protein SXCC_01295 [Gluconacetobacter sp. SXCC-1]
MRKDAQFRQDAITPYGFQFRYRGIGTAVIYKNDFRTG